MISAFLFFLFLSVANVSLNAPVDTDDDFETPILHDDIAIPDPSVKNADPCTAKGCMWPKTGSLVYVPVEFSNDYSNVELEFLIMALMEFHQHTCIRFKQRTNERDFIHFFSGKGCYSYIGRQNGGQKISLARHGCLITTSIQHEVFHALGFNHKQVRSDRDKYVKIFFQNIQEGKEHNFDKVETNNLGTPYDFSSIMEYDNKAFSKNGKDTIVSRKNPNLKFGHAAKMSRNDIARINKLYKCN
uniref:Metalloendopeptidase n=1 Tax=Poecilia formosa TaxID=48698 RepID=A0A087XXS8_POEFO